MRESRQKHSAVWLAHSNKYREKYLIGALKCSSSRLRTENQQCFYVGVCFSMSFNVSKSCLFFNEGSWEVRMHVSAGALLEVVESDRWDNDLCVGSALWGWTEPRAGPWPVARLRVYIGKLCPDTKKSVHFPRDKLVRTRSRAPTNGPSQNVSFYFLSEK